MWAIVVLRLRLAKARHVQDSSSTQYMPHERMALAICGIWWVRIARVPVHRVTSPRVLNDIPVRRISARGYASSEKVDSP